MSPPQPRGSDWQEAAVRELQADLLLWRGLLDQLPAADPLAAILELRVASIEAILQRKPAS